jgi:MFS family permease
MKSLSPLSLLITMCLAQGLAMLTGSTFAALLPVFQMEWRLSNTEAGWISGVFFAGYVVAVPVLVSLTDRLDSRKIYLVSAAINTVAGIGFAYFSDGVWSSSFWRILQGVGLAGVYMPGLKALTDRLPENRHGRAIAYYTSSFGVGSSISYLLAMGVLFVLSWSSAFIRDRLGLLVTESAGRGPFNRATGFQAGLPQSPGGFLHFGLYGP